jgi:hypothetical protein
MGLNNAPIVGMKFKMKIIKLQKKAPSTPKITRTTKLKMEAIRAIKDFIPI